MPPMPTSARSPHRCLRSPHRWAPSPPRWPPCAPPLRARRPRPGGWRPSTGDCRPSSGRARSGRRRLRSPQRSARCWRRRAPPPARPAATTAPAGARTPRWRRRRSTCIPTIPGSTVSPPVRSACARPCATSTRGRGCQDRLPHTRIQPGRHHIRGCHAAVGLPQLQL